MTRRFVCPPDPIWALLQDLVRLAGLMAVLLAVMLQRPPPFWTLIGAATTLVGAGLCWSIRQARVRRTRCDPPQSLRWDTQSWWLQPAGAPLAEGASADAGASAPAQAVHLQVLLDVEHWMLLRLVPVGSEGRFWRHRCLAVSRRQQGGHWSLLRIHLFMARS
jgi:hypothetical protein